MTLIKQFAIGLFLILFFTSCKEKMDHYAEPDWVGEPIYYQLIEEGRFTNYTWLLDTMGYKDILGRTGYFTVMAPNDEAFNTFFAEQGVSSVDQLDTVIMRQIVEYTIIDNGYTRRTLAAYQSPDGWEYDKAFRRLTRANEYYSKDSLFIEAFYDPISDEYTYVGVKKEVYIRNKERKHMPVLTDLYLVEHGLSSSSISTLLPEVNWDGFIISDANVSIENIIAGNGYIYELKKVILPLPNLDEMLNEHPQAGEFSTFAGMLDKMYVGLYDSAEYYGLPVYEKYYFSDLNIEPDDESWLSSESNISQTNCWTMFVPNNEAMDEFFKQKILKYYSSIDEALETNGQLFFEIINDHIYSKAIWPEKIESNSSLFGKSVSQNDIYTSKLTSNGFFYGINTTLEPSNIFSSVYSEIYLNTDYRFIYTAIDWFDEGLKNVLTNKNVDYTIFLVSDSIYKANNWDNAIMGYFYIKPDATVNRDEEFMEMVYAGIVRGDVDLSGKGILESYDGAYLKYEDGKVWGPGNEENNEQITAAKIDAGANNGDVYKLNNLILQATKTVTDLLTTPPTDASYARFLSYLNKSNVILGHELVGYPEGTEYTLLVPTDAAIDFVALPDPATTDSAEVAAINNFVAYHIVPNKKIFTSASTLGNVNTAYMTGKNGKLNVYASMTIGGSSGNLTITDGKGNIVNVLNNNASDVISVNNRVILQIDKVLEYE